MNIYKQLTYAAVFLIISLVGACGYAQAAEESNMENSPTETKLREKIDLYCSSIVNADDVSIAEQVWAVTPESSFIHPRGHEVGWEQIKQHFYSNTMAKSFSKRQLTLVGEPQIHVYDNAATAEFEWDFVAIRRDDGSTRHTTGRESQVFINMPDLGWRLVHVHYSTPPVATK